MQKIVGTMKLNKLQSIIDSYSLDTQLIFTVELRALTMKDKF